MEEALSGQLLAFQLEPSPPNAAGIGNVQVGTARLGCPWSAARKFRSSRTTESNFSGYESFYYNAGSHRDSCRAKSLSKRTASLLLLPHFPDAHPPRPRP